MTLVHDAGAQRAPFVRMADRYAALLLPVTVLLAGGAWAVSGDAVRALAVLVVATPCPLILAAPIALVSGVSRAARIGVVVKGAAAIEQLGRARTVLLDKTGTLTLGALAVEHVVALDGHGEDELLRVAASLDQLSAHVVAEALVHDAERRGLGLGLGEARDVHERPGDGIEGTVENRHVAVGSRAYMDERGVAASATQTSARGRACVQVAVDGTLAGTIVMADRPREDAAAAVRALRAGGARRVVMVTGDDRATAQEVARGVGIDEVFADCAPADKLAVLRAIARDPAARPVVMVGDGINDAPVLAAADVGVAMAAMGATVSTEAADVVITVDRIDRVAEALRIGQRSLAIARQSVLAGMGLSLVAMIAAALGPHPARRRRTPAGGHRRRRHPQRAARPARLTARLKPAPCSRGPPDTTGRRRRDAGAHERGHRDQPPHHPTSGSARLLGLDSHRDSRAIRARTGNLPGDFPYLVEAVA